LKINKRELIYWGMLDAGEKRSPAPGGEGAGGRGWMLDARYGIRDDGRETSASLSRNLADFL